MNLILGIICRLKMYLCLVVLMFNISNSCKTSDWRNMTMEEILVKADIVVYGEDIGHGKLRNPEELDARFQVYCVFKSAAYNVPSQVIIEDIRGYDKCAGVQLQTQVGEKYILGLMRTFNGYTKYAEINPLQKTTFVPSSENFKRVIATCGLDQWKPPKTGEQDKCPVVSKPRFCTKVRDPATVSTASSLNDLVMPLSLFLAVMIFLSGPCVQDFM